MIEQATDAVERINQISKVANTRKQVIMVHLAGLISEYVQAPVTICDIVDKTIHVYDGIEHIAKALKVDVCRYNRVDRTFRYEYSFTYEGIKFFEMRDTLIAALEPKEVT